MKLFTTEIINIGQEAVIDSCPENTENSVVFEDDGSTGYFYAIERSGNTELKILDAVHIYNVDNIADRHIPSEIKIYWTNDLTKSALTINGDFHAIIDFKNKQGLCRTGFPKPSKTWSGDQRLLTEIEINDFIIE